MHSIRKETSVMTAEEMKLKHGGTFQFACERCHAQQEWLCSGANDMSYATSALMEQEDKKIRKWNGHVHAWVAGVTIVG
jgi:hypothetical protein